ncbi:MAG: PFL_4695 family integrating conjugative element protein [Pseudomonadota bacterium]
MFLVCLLLFGSQVQAEPLVIYDAGQGVSIARYKTLFSAGETPDFRNSWLFKELPEADAAGPTPEKTFPIRTSRLTPRRLTRERESYFAAMIYPICVIGTDDLSKAWIMRNLQPLIEMNAQCLLVAAESGEEARELLKLAQGLAIFPAHGDAIAEYFKIEHYPVLITDRYVSQ